MLIRCMPSLNESVISDDYVSPAAGTETRSSISSQTDFTPKPVTRNLMFARRTLKSDGYFPNPQSTT